MKKLFLYLVIVGMAACGRNTSPETGNGNNKGNTDNTTAPRYKGPDYNTINNCLRTTLSYKLQVEPRDYDSIATYYFHEIRDYSDQDVRAKNVRLNDIKQLLRDSAATMPAENLKALEKEADVLQQEVNAHYKNVIGYVFVHSFRIRDKDTMSAIFVMDQDCGFKEFIKVKVISDPNPEDYVESIRSIER